MTAITMRRNTALLLLLHTRTMASFSARELKRAQLDGVRRRPNAKQSLGQNFLVDVNLAKRIATSVAPAGEDGNRVIELGPGQGALTGHLFERFPKMRAVEIDERMIGVLRETLPELDLAHGDMLQLDLGAMADEAGGRLSLVSNTPFYLTSPLLFKLVAATEHVESAVLTTQKEVCDKILSPPSKKDYGILAVMLQLFGGPKHLFDLPPEAFAPVPKVHSSVLSLSPSAIPPGEDEPLTPSQRAAILGLLKVTFEVRRKMLRVSLRKMIETGTRAASHLLLSAGTHTLSLSRLLSFAYTHIHTNTSLHAGAIQPPPDEFLTKRPEQLSPSEWLVLARSCFGDDLGEGSVGGDKPLPKLERHHISKAFKAHKAGYLD